MGDQNIHTFPGGGSSETPAYQQPSRIPMSYRFSPDELKVLKECNQESFFQRSMPLGFAFGLGTYTAVQQGYLKSNIRFGALPKVTLAVIVGYFMGKLSYQQKCAKKLMALPNSYIGQLLRDKRDGKINNSHSPGTSIPMFGASPNDIYSDAGPGSSLNLDTDRPSHFSEDNYTHEDISSSPEVTPILPSTSYDDLRKKNRGDYSESHQDPYRVDAVAPANTRTRSPQSTPKITNKYGDSME